MLRQGCFSHIVTPALALATAFCGGVKANAQIALTPDAVTAGFGLSTFATNVPNSGSTGPLGIAFPATGGVVVTDYPGNARFLPTDADGQNIASVPVAQNYGVGDAVDLASVGSSIYMTQQNSGNVVQINPDGTFNQLIVSGVPFATGMVADPLNGHLFVSTGNNNLIEDIDPLAKTNTLFVNAQLDGLTFSPDGSTLYGADYNNGRIIGISTSTKAVTFDSGFIPGIVDGTALGEGTLAGNIFVNTNGGTIYEVNLTTKQQTLIASGGSRGDFVTVDPNGTLLLTQTDSIVRLTAPNGGGFGGNSVPEPSALTLLAGVGSAGLLLRRRACK